MKLTSPAFNINDVVLLSLLRTHPFAWPVALVTLRLPDQPARIAGILLIAVVIGGTPADTQAQDVDSTLADRFQLADSFLRAGQYDHAIVLLQDLYAASPENFAFYEKLKEAYESVKRYDDAATLVQEKLAADRSAPLLSDLARIYYLRGDEEEAFAAWEEAIETDPRSANSYRVVYQSLIDVRQFDYAIDVLRRARENTGRGDLFRSDLAYLNSLTGRHEEAMDEYVALLQENDRQLAFVRSRLSRFIEQEEPLRASIAAASRAVRKEPLNRALRELLGWLYIEAEEYEKAFDAYRAMDRLEQEDGQILFSFAQLAADAAAYDVALQVFEEILERYPDAPSAPQALAGLGEMYERWAEKTGERAVDERGERIPAPHYEKAIAIHKQFVEQYPTNALYPDVLRRIGRLQQEVFYELAEAESTLRRVIDRYPHTQAADQAEFDLGRTALMRGELDEARLRFSRIEERLRTGELAELARFELAQLHFFTGEFESAQSLVDILDTNTSTDVANDAIELKLLLIENRGPDSLDAPLKMYARARLLREQLRPAAALDTLDALLGTYPDHRLVDDVRFLRADLLRAIGKSEEAYAAFAELPLMHPRSHLADRSLFYAAEILQTELDDRDRAIETYARLLRDYPGSLLASEVRDRIRRLRGGGV